MGAWQSAGRTKQQHGSAGKMTVWEVRWPRHQISRPRPKTFFVFFLAPQLRHFDIVASACPALRCLFVGSEIRAPKCWHIFSGGAP